MSKDNPTIEEDMNSVKEKCPKCGKDMFWWGMDGDWHCEDCEKASEHNNIRSIKCNICKKIIMPNKNYNDPDCYVLQKASFDSEDTVETYDIDKTICIECYNHIFPKNEKSQEKLS